MSKSSQVAELIRKADTLGGKVLSLQERKDGLSDSVAQNKRFVDVQPEVAAVLSDLQTRAHERSVGVYEKLLTAILHDVLGENDRSVSMDLEIKRGVPSLEINIKHQGETESIIDGQGGSVANIVSAGLRFIVLNRLSDNRQFIVIDEPDCWLAPEKINSFFSVIDKLSKDIGIQVLIISHHEKSLFGDVGIVELVNTDGKGSIEAETIKEGREWADDEEGIRSIRLINFMSHEFTHIDLNPNITVIRGENNLGKSAVVSALRGMFFNEGKDNMVRHGEKEAIVEVTVEDGAIIRWIRKNKGANRTKYELINSDFHLLHEEFNGNEVPSWADSLLRVRKESDIDVHVGRQKIPLFMIGETPSKCASVLSVGRESKYLHAMIAENKTQVQHHKRSTKEGEKEFGDIDKILSTDEVSSLPTLREELEALSISAESLDKAPSELEAMNVIINRLKSFDKRYSDYLGAADGMTLPETPSIHKGLEEMSEAIESLNTADALYQASNMLNVVVVPHAPSLLETENLLEYGRKLFNMQQRVTDYVEIFKDLELPAQSSYLDTAEMLEVGKGMSSVNDELSASATELDKDKAELLKIEEELNEFDFCPLCGTGLEHEGLDNKTEHSHSKPSM